VQICFTKEVTKKKNPSKIIAQLNLYSSNTRLSGVSCIFTGLWHSLSVKDIHV